jgi:membrane protein
MFKELITTPTEKLGKFSRFVIYQLRLWRQCARLLKKNHAGQQAAALSYHTIFGLVPLAIVTLLIFQSLGTSQELGNKVKDFFYEQAHLSTIEIPNPADANGTVKLTAHIDKISSRFFTAVNKGSVTILSSIIVVWVALALLGTIERAFNNIYHVPRGRSFIRRMVNYWTLLTLGPLLLALGMYVTARFTPVGRIQTSITQHLGPAALSYIISALAFFFLYFVLPNTRVSARAAVWGAMVAALVWSIVKWLFGFYVTEYQPYSTLYGALGLVPLSVLWIHISWLIVLFGLQLTFTTQHLKTLDAAEIAATQESEKYFLANDFTIINVMVEVCRSFRAGSGPVTTETICSKLNLPAEFGEKVLDLLVAENLLARTSEPKMGFLPAREPEDIKLSEVSAAVANAGFGRQGEELPGALKQVLQSQQNNLAQYNLEQISNSHQMD